jgi:hypothetical protein
VKWAVNFIRPINPSARHSKDIYIITETTYLMQWDEVEAVHDCSIDITTRFIFENIIARFGFSRSLTSDQGSHFIRSTIKTLTKQFLIQHHKRNPYHQ